MSQMNERCVGIVDSVSAYEVKGYLFDSSPKSVSLTSGTLNLFPRINGIVIIPNETGSLVGMINWIGYNHIKTDAEVNLPKCTRMISIAILGHIEHGIKGLSFERGAFSLPTVGDQILLPTVDELETVVKNDGEECITIGTSPLTGNQPVNVSVNELFGRHLAVLGNTGSGKSCTVASVIRSAIEASRSKREKSPNARFIILDPNGEYQNAFDDLDIDVCKFTVKDFSKDKGEQLRLPAWMWTSSEWASILQASDKTQKPILREALRLLRSANYNVQDSNVSEVTLRKSVYYLKMFLWAGINGQNYFGKPQRNDFGKSLRKKVEVIQFVLNKIDANNPIKKQLGEVCDNINAILTDLHGYYKGNEYYNDFQPSVVSDMYNNVQTLYKQIEEEDTFEAISEDDPIEFNIKDLPMLIANIANESSAEQYVDFMITRVNGILKNTLLLPVVGNEKKISLLEWIQCYLGSKEDEKGKICIIDLSLLPSEIIHLLVATIARLVFEALQRYRKFYGKELPTLLVMEEAHSFIHKYSLDEGDNADRLCTQIFEKIAREGRKYGLGLVVSSQRPAELSPTVLSQCNSFILHRIVNDRDQEMVKRMVPDNFGGLLAELPQLPTKKAIIMGSVVSLPTIVDINDLPQVHRPKSETPDFWQVWTGAEERSLNWAPIVEQWQNSSVIPSTNDGEDNLK